MPKPLPVEEADTIFQTAGPGPPGTVPAQPASSPGNPVLHREAASKQSTKHALCPSSPGNPVLLRFLGGVNLDQGDVRIRQLVLKILQTCPDLVPAYMLDSRLLSDPQLSLRWLQRVSLLGR